MSKEEHDEEVKREKSEEMKIAMAIEASKRDHEQVSTTVLYSRLCGN